MEKQHLSIAALVVGLVALVVGAFAFLEARKATKKAMRATADLEEARIEHKLTEVRETVEAKLKKNDADTERKLEPIREQIRGLADQSGTLDIISQARAEMTRTTGEISDRLTSTTLSVRKSMKEGDRDLVEMIKSLKVELDEKFKENSDTLKRQVLRWMESGAM